MCYPFVYCLSIHIFVLFICLIVVVLFFVILRVHTLHRQNRQSVMFLSYFFSLSTFFGLLVCFVFFLFSFVMLCCCFCFLFFCEILRN